jgi:hypothetical protein
MRKPNKTIGKTVIVERLDPRRLMSSTGSVNFTGQYEVVKSGILYDVNLTAGSAGTYTGTVWANGTVAPLTGTESASGVLSGHIDTSLGEVAYSAALSGKALTVTYIASGREVGLLQTSTTPATEQPALVSGSGSLLTYLKPANWTVTQSASGMMLRSHNKTEQVGVLGTVTEGTSTLASIASAEESAGVKLIYGKVLAKKSTSTETFQSGVALVTFDYKGTAYAAAEAVETYTYTRKGTYDAKTKTYSGVTLTEIYEASAPKAEFINDNSFLLYMMTSIKANSTLTTGSTPAGAKKAALSNPGLIVPGITPSTTKKGKTKATPADGLYNSLYKNNYYDTAEGDLLQYESLEQQAAVDSSVNEFCNELLS